jgi:hypothetical protein
MHFCMAQTIPWEWYRTFLAVMKEGSLSGAARVLAITQPTAGRHVAALESALGWFYLHGLKLACRLRMRPPRFRAMRKRWKTRPK